MSSPARMINWSSSSVTSPRNTTVPNSVSNVSSICISFYRFFFGLFLVTVGTENLQIIRLTKQIVNEQVPIFESLFWINHWFLVVNLNIFRSEFPTTACTMVMLCHTTCFGVHFLFCFGGVKGFKLGGPAAIASPKSGGYEATVSSFCPISPIICVTRFSQSSPSCR